jgi:hypothetical protein
MARHGDTRRAVAAAKTATGELFIAPTWLGSGGMRLAPKGMRECEISGSVPDKGGRERRKATRVTRGHHPQLPQLTLVFALPSKQSPHSSIQGAL